MSMMGIKQGTRAWSPAPQSQSAQPSEANTLSPAEKQKELAGADSLGEVLNKVADQNYVDPAKVQRKVGNNQLDKDAFLKLMLAQMKHQDPTNPMQSHEMAAQLAQFTSLEQLNNINTTLESMKQAAAPATSYQALSFIGKRAAGDSSKLTRGAGDSSHDVSFQLLGDAASVKMTVKDAEGNVVRKLDFPNLKKGVNSVRWNGITEDGVAARTGEYKISIEATGASGGKVFAKTEFDGKITGVNYTAQGPVLMVGTQTIRLQDVKRIVEDDPRGPSVPAPTAVEATPPQASMRSAATATALAMTGAAAGRAAYPMAASAAPLVLPSYSAADARTPKIEAGVDNVPVAEDAEYKSTIMNDVAMSREMVNKVAKAQ